MPDEPPTDPARLLHDRLLGRHPGGVEAANALFRRPLVARLSARTRYRRTDPHQVEDAVVDALLEYVGNPAAWRPDAGRSLDGYLAMAAERNLLNLLRSEGRRRAREREAATRRHREHGTSKTSVELDSPAGNVIQEDEQQRQTRDVARLLALLPDPADRKVLELRLRNERRTTAFAAALGLTHLPPAEQRRQVKRAKDRIDKALRRGVAAGARGNADGASVPPTHEP